MTKEERISRLAERLIDPWTDCPEEYEDAELITLDEARGLLDDLLYEDEDMDDEDYCVPAGTTPELLMEVFNCIVRMNKRELHIKRMAEYITENECICEYCNYFEGDNYVDIAPTDWLFDEMNAEEFPFTLKDGSHPDLATIITIGQHSPEFSMDHEYCWFDAEKLMLFSTDTPFADGILDAEAFARMMFDDESKDCIEYFVNDLMLADDVKHVFGMSREEVAKLYRIDSLH